MTSVGTGFGLSGGPITAAGTLAVNPSEIATVATNQSISGAKDFTGHLTAASELWVDDLLPTTITTRLNNYVLEVSTLYAGRTKTIPHAVFLEYCGDADGCDLTLGMKMWTSATETAPAHRTIHLFYSSTNNAWRTSLDVSGIDGNGVAEHALNVFDTCYLTDGSYLAFSSTGDAAVGMALLMWNGFAGPSRRCTLVIRD